MKPPISMRWAVPLALLLACAQCANFCVAQSTGQATARFEVASVKVSAPDAYYTSWSKPGDFAFHATNASLLGLVVTAYGVTEMQVANLPSWTDKIHYDIVAHPVGETPLNNDQLKQALQQLLKERLHLAAHFESKQVKGIRLVAVDGSSKLKPSNGGTPGHTEFDDKGFRAHNITMEQLLPVLQIALRDQNYESFVENDTNILGSFDVRLNFAQKADDSSLPTLFDALPKQLGLRLVPGTVKADMLVVDHVDRSPVAN